MTKNTPLAPYRHTLAWLLGSIAIAGGIGWGARQYILPADTADPAVLIVWALALILALGGIVNAFAQARQLATEGSVLARLQVPQIGPELERIDKALGARAARSAVVSRARLVDAVLQNQHMPAGDFRADWRRDTVERTARYGATQRFLASMLLLLAVLGTFAGLKSALPRLSDAMQNAMTQQQAQAASGSRGRAIPRAGRSQASSGQSASGVTDALDMVAAAFGANFLALLGSLVLGAAAHGLAQDRRALLARVDEVATRVWYVQLPADAGFSTLERALVEMRGSVVGVTRVGDAVTALTRRLEDFQSALVDSMQSMVGDVRASMQASAIAAERRNDAQLTELTRTLALITRALERTAVGYEGLVKGLEERDLGVTKAADALDRSAQQAAATNASLETATRELAGLRQESEQREAGLTRQVEEALTTLRSGLDSIRRSVAVQSSHLEESNRLLEQLRVEEGESWRRNQEAHGAQLATLREQLDGLQKLGELLETLREGQGAARAELTGLRADTTAGVHSLEMRADQSAAARKADAEVCLAALRELQRELTAVLRGEGEQLRTLAHHESERTRAAILATSERMRLTEPGRPAKPVGA